MLSRVRTPRPSQHGLGIVELLVGLAVGLFVVAGGLLLFAGFVDADRRLVVETRMMQDLRAASDIVTRDIRRGGYWQNAHTQVWSTGAVTQPRNPYALQSTSSCSAASVASAASDPSGTFANTCYWIDVAGNDTADDSDRYGFSVSNGILRAVYANGAAVDLTDPNAVEITGLSINWTSQPLSLASSCVKACTSNCPTIVVREALVTISGKVPGESASAVRSLTSNVRVRNDFFSGVCPA